MNWIVGYGAVEENALSILEVMRQFLQQLKMGTYRALINTDSILLNTDSTLLNTDF
jgi:hypothetical protein